MATPQWLYNKTVAVFDLETDRIPTTKIYMNGVALIKFNNIGEATVIHSEVYTTTWTKYTNGSLMQSLIPLIKADFICGHNVCGFDIPEILKHLGVQLKAPVLDTIILAKIMYSKDALFTIDAQLGLPKDLWGSYSLKAFGQRLGNDKLHFEDFDEMTEDMAIYCNQDVNLTADLLLHLLAQDNFPLEQVVELEHKAAAIIAQQTAAGFYFDVDKATILNTELLREKGDIARKLAGIFKPKFLKDGPVKKYKKKLNTRIFIPNPTYKGAW